MKPDKAQQEDIDNWLEAGMIGLNASQTGYGKSILGVGSVMQSNAQTVLIVGPKSTFRSWGNTFQKMNGWELRQIDSSSKGKEAFGSLAFGIPGAYFVGTEMFRKYDWGHVRPDIALIDEIHKLSTRDTVGMKMLHKFHPKMKLALSATPMRNKLENIWGALKWLYPEMEHWIPNSAYFDRHPDKKPTDRSIHSPAKDYVRQLQHLNPKHFWQFAELFFDIKDDFFRGLVITDELIENEVLSLLPHYRRHLKRDFCCEHHPEGFADWDEPVDERIVLPMTPAMKRLYKQVDEEQVAWLNSKPMAVGLSITERLRKAEVALGEMVLGEDDIPYFSDDAKSPKLDWVVEQMEDGVLEGEQFVCFTHSRKFAHVAAKRLGAFEWSGNSKQKDRDQAAQDFENGDLRVIVAVISAAGTGTDFMQKASNAVWFSETSDITDNEQARGRLDRRGQVKGVMNWILLSEGTEEAGWMSDRMAKALKLERALGD